jgi:malate dehydrogenase (oxaloacetate-decarboxylating)
MAETGAFIREAVAVGMKAQEQGLARIRISCSELHKKSESMINSAREQADALVKAGCIAPVAKAD